MIRDDQLSAELLPPKVTMFRRVIREEMKICYAFFHYKHGSLGQIYFSPVPDGRLFMQCEVAGSEGAPMTEKRKELLMPLTQLVPSQIERIYGKGGAEPPAIMRNKGSLIESKILVCLSCDEPVAFLVFAKDTLTPSEGDASPELEDYACLMHQKIVDYNVPAWVIGDSDELGNNIGHAWVLKIWPTREEATPFRSDELNRIFNCLQTTHCKNLAA